MTPWTPIRREGVEGMGAPSEQASIPGQRRGVTTWTPIRRKGVEGMGAPRGSAIVINPAKRARRNAPGPTFLFFYRTISVSSTITASA